MRTAFEIVNDVNLKLRGCVYTDDYMSNELLYEMINEARKEAIEECAERAKSEWIRFGTNMGHAVYKESILSLIKELK